MAKPEKIILDYAGPHRDTRQPDIFTDGRTDLYIRMPEGELPRRCLVCNGRVNSTPQTIQLNYVDPEIRRSYRGGIMFYWVFILTVIVRRIHERAVRKSIRVTYSICPHHRGNRGVLVVLRCILILACIALMPAAQIFSLGDGVTFISCIAIVLNLIYPWPKRLLRIDRMTATHAVIVGPSEDFLQSLRQPRGL